jgi:hypothetical protein
MARDVDRDIVCIFERPDFVTLCYDCEDVVYSVDYTFLN